MRSMTALMAAGLLLMSGCGDKAPPPEAPATSEAPKAVEESGAGGAKAQIALEGTMSPADYEKLLLGLAECGVGSNGIDRKCESWKAFDAARKDRKVLLRNMAGELGEMGRQHLSHAAPAVRLQAARLASSLFGGDASSRDALVAAAKAEKDAHVLRAMLRSVRSSIGRSDAVRTLLLEMVDHPDEQVRITVLGALSASWARDTEGTLEKVIEAVSEDPSPQVRAYACRQLGDRADARALPLLEKMTAGPADDVRLYSACFRGLVGMWAAPVPHKAPSEKAYRLTLLRLTAKPRTREVPPWAAIANLDWAARPALAKNAPWFEKSAVIDALADLVADRDAHWLARSGAVKTMGKLGARVARFETLRDGYADAAKTPGVDKQVYEAIAEMIVSRKKAQEAVDKLKKEKAPADKPAEKPADAPAEASAEK